jgi:chromosome segregation ATPase
LTGETQSLESAYRSYAHLDRVERVREGIQGLSGMVEKVPALKSQIKEEEKKLEVARESVKENEARLREYKKVTGAAEKENIDSELDKIRQTLASQMDLLRKSMSKMRELAEVGTLHVRPDHVSTIDLYSRDIVEALSSEADGCPAFGALLTEMKKVIGSLGLEGSRERRTVKRIDSLLSGDLIASSQKRVKELLQKRQELSREFKPGEEKRILSDLEESRKLLRDEETRIHRLNKELDEITSKLKKNTKDISSEIAKLTGIKVHISLGT